VPEPGLPSVLRGPGGPRGHSLGERRALGVGRARAHKLPAALVAGRGHGQLGVAAEAAPEAQPVAREDCHHHCAEGWMAFAF